MNNKDLIIQSMKAHLVFMQDRILDESKLFWFFQKAGTLIQYLEEDRDEWVMKLNCEKILMKDSGSNLAIDIYNEISYNITSRFETGYSKDMGVEKL